MQTTRSSHYTGLRFIPTFNSQPWAGAEASRFEPWTHAGDFPPPRLTCPLGLTLRKATALHLQARCLASSAEQPHRCHTTEARHFQRKASASQAIFQTEWMGGLRRRKSEYNLPTCIKVRSLLTGVTGRVSTLPFFYLHRFSSSFQ